MKRLTLFLVFSSLACAPAFGHIKVTFTRSDNIQNQLENCQQYLDTVQALGVDPANAAIVAAVQDTANQLVTFEKTAWPDSTATDWDECNTKGKVACGLTGATPVWQKMPCEVKCTDGGFMRLKVVP